MGRFAAHPRLDDLGITVRSGWEADIAYLCRFLEGRGVLEFWKYEPKTFRFTSDAGCFNSKGKPYLKGPYDYRPDFELKFSADLEHTWWEVKGRLYPGDRTRLKRFERHYPREFARLVIIDAPAYRKLEAMWARAVPGWGSTKRHR